MHELDRFHKGALITIFIAEINYGLIGLVDLDIIYILLGRIYLLENLAYIIIALSVLCCIKLIDEFKIKTSLAFMIVIAANYSIQGLFYIDFIGNIIGLKNLYILSSLVSLGFIWTVIKQGTDYKGTLPSMRKRD